jgi:cytoskeletal protein CcmA (bactofilin family)
MALWKEQPQGGNASQATSVPPAAPREPEKVAPIAASVDSARRAERPAAKESLIAADLAIEGKIEGAGHVRIAGRFKGDVHVDGNLTVEQGAHLTGQVYAKTVVIAGELHGNIVGAVRVELLESGVLAGDVKAGTLTVAAGSRMRGSAEFGWEEKSVKSVATG